MRTLFISEKYIKENSVIDENTDYKKILPTVWQCQMQYIQNLLGTKLYEYLIAEINDLIDNSTPLDAVDKTLIDDYISDTHLYWCEYELQIPLLYETRNKNVSKNRSDNGEPVSLRESYRIENRFKDKAEFFSKRLTDYLCANKDLYPAYCTEDELDEVRPKQARATTSLYLNKVIKGVFGSSLSNQVIW